MMDNKIIYGIIGVVSLLLGFGGNEALSPNVIDQTYVCTNNMNVGTFDSISSTGVTGYFIDEYGDKRGKQCRDVGWTPIEEYALSKGVNVETIINTEPVEKIVEKVVYTPSPDLKVIAYTDDGKYFCEGIGPGQRCKKTTDILSELG